MFVLRAQEGALPRARASVVQRMGSASAGAAKLAGRKPLGAFGGIIVLVMVVIALGSRFDILPLDDPRHVDHGEIYTSPFAHSDSSQHTATGTHILGTDHLGRDILSRTLHGAWISLYIGIGSVLIGITAGFVLGVITAYAGGIADMAFQRLVDAMMTISGLIIALAIVAVLGASLNNVILAIVIGMVAPVVRTVRSQVLSVKEMDYVLAARALGAPPWRIVFFHIAPNCFAIYLILATYYLGFAIIIEASLSFLGVGAPPDEPSWGGMLSRAAVELETGGGVTEVPWVFVAPALAIFLVVLSINLVGDSLRDLLDPRLRGR